jgi:hypothetical protein
MTREQQWKKFAEQMDGKVGAEVADAYKQLYSVFDETLVDWAANLFDPTIGGFYYSNGARDNEGFLPDIESTHQSLEMFRDLGLANDFDRSYPKALPAWMNEKIISFTKGLQHPNGYFYHPQWTVEDTDSKPHRRGRDLMWSNSILRNYGVLPTYDCPDGVKGERPAVIPGNESAPEADRGKIVYAPHLQSGKAFREYLEKVNIRKSSYWAGSLLASQLNQINQRNTELGGEIFEVLFDWLDSNQNTEMGHWDFREPGTEEFIPYHGQNGLFKISFVYTMAKRPIPNIEKSIKVAMDGIYSDDPVGIVCDVYNSWYTLSSLMGNIKATHSKEEGERKIAEIRRELYKNAAGAVLKTRDKIKDLRRPDGGFSYMRIGNCPVSQDMPITLKGLHESDVNATIISAPQLINFSMDVLGLGDRPPIFQRPEYDRYIAILEENRKKAGV